MIRLQISQKTGECKILETSPSPKEEALDKMAECLFAFPAFKYIYDLYHQAGIAIHEVLFVALVKCVLTLTDENQEALFKIVRDDFESHSVFTSE